MKKTTAIEKTRIGGSKVRTGCITCKTRRVKCDEGKPVCQRCTKAGRTCDGYASSPDPEKPTVGHRFVHYVGTTKGGTSSRMDSPASSVSSSPAPKRSPSPFSQLDEVSLRCLDFYINATALALGEPFGINIFSRPLIQFMQHEKAIQHSIIALAALHESYLNQNGDVFDNQRQLSALSHYNKSIQAVVNSNQCRSEHASLITLVTCLMYCGIESVQGHFVSAMKHIGAGIRLLAEHEAEMLDQERVGRGVSVGFVDALRRLFITLGTQAMGIDDAGIDQATIAYIQTQDDDPITDYTFTTTEQALVDCSTLWNDVTRFMTWADTCSENADFPDAALLRSGEILDRRYDNWIRQYHHLLQRSGASQAPGTHPDHLALLILRINELMLHMVMQNKYYNDQSAFDEYLPEFQLIVAAAADFLEIDQRRRGEPKSRSSPRSLDDTAPSRVFSLTPGILPGLHFTCTRCRHYETRHKALELMQRSGRQESVWDSRPVGQVAQRFIEIEEAKATQYWHAQGMEAGREGPYEIPANSRLRMLFIDFNEPEDSAQISFIDLFGTQQHKQTFAWTSSDQYS